VTALRIGPINELGLVPSTRTSPFPCPNRALSRTCAAPQGVFFACPVRSHRARARRVAAPAGPRSAASNSQTKPEYRNGDQTNAEADPGEKLDAGHAGAGVSCTAMPRFWKRWTRRRVEAPSRGQKLGLGRLSNRRSLGYGLPVISAASGRTGTTGNEIAGDADDHRQPRRPPLDPG
jgi:hypothetical protein